MKIYCSNCKESHQVTKDNFASRMPSQDGRPTVCPKCKSNSIALEFELKDTGDIAKLLVWERGATTKILPPKLKKRYGVKPLKT